MAKELTSTLGRKREREEVLRMLQRNPVIYARFLELTEGLQEDLVAFCMGSKGLRITGDPFFKAVFNPEVFAERLSELLTAILKERVTVKRALPNESNRLTAEGSLLIMAILVELESGGLANIEIQRIGYLIPGERGACYSADLVLRQYVRVKGEHHARQIFDTNLNLELLQEYIYIPLDIFLDLYHRNPHNIDKELDAWLLFLASDDPADIARLIDAYPKFRELYAEIAAFQQKPVELVNMYSKELEIIDLNTVKYMIEEQARQLAEKDSALSEKEVQLEA